MAGSPDVDTSWQAPSQAWAYGSGRRRRRLVLPIVLVLLAVAGAGAFLALRDGAADRVAHPTTPEAGGLPLAVTFREGETYRYRFALTMDGTAGAMDASRPVDAALTQVVAFEVRSVDANEVATVRATVERMTGTMSGRDLPVARDRPGGTLRITPRGEVTGGLASAPASFSPLAAPVTNQFLPLLPDEPIRPGDRWEGEALHEAPYGTGTARSFTGEFLGYEPVDGVRAALIRSAFSSPLDLTVDLRDLPGGAADMGIVPDNAPRRVEYAGTVEGRQYSWLDPRSGELLRTTTAADLDVTLRFRGRRAGAFPEIALQGRLGLEVTPR